MIRFKCEGCGIAIKTEVENAGSHKPCPKCNKIVMVPELHVAEERQPDTTQFSESQLQFAVERRDRAISAIDFAVGLTQFATFIAAVACLLLIFFSFSPEVIASGHASQYLLAGATGLGWLVFSVPAILSFLYAIRLLADMHAVHFPRKTAEEK